jgi:hypothetical protein
MQPVAHPENGGDTDPPERRTRSAALRLTPEEAKHLRVAIRKVAAARGGFVALAVAIGIPTNTLYHAANPKGRPSAALAIRLAGVAGVPVEVILTGKLAVEPAVIGRAA